MLEALNWQVLVVTSRASKRLPRLGQGRGTETRPSPNNSTIAAGAQKALFFRRRLALIKHLEAGVHLHVTIVLRSYDSTHKSRGIKWCRRLQRTLVLCKPCWQARLKTDKWWNHIILDNPEFRGLECILHADLIVTISKRLIWILI